MDPPIEEEERAANQEKEKQLTSETTQPKERENTLAGERQNTEAREHNPPNETHQATLTPLNPISLSQDLPSPLNGPAISAKSTLGTHTYDLNKPLSNKQSKPPITPTTTFNTSEPLIMQPHSSSHGLTHTPPFWSHPPQQAVRFNYPQPQPI